MTKLEQGAQLALDAVAFYSDTTKFDGIRYPESVQAETLSELYVNSRMKHFNKEEKLKILLGCLLLTEGHEYSGLYRKAQLIKGGTK